MNHGFSRITRGLAIVASFSALVSCSVRSPLLCVGTGPVTKEHVLSIRALARDVAKATAGKLTDTSEHYATRSVGTDLSVGFTIEVAGGEGNMLSSGTLNPVACFYGDPKAAGVDQLIEQMVDGIHRLNLPMTLENAGKLPELPITLQQKIASVTARNTEEVREH